MERVKDVLALVQELSEQPGKLSVIKKNHYYIAPNGDKLPAGYHVQHIDGLNSYIRDRQFCCIMEESQGNYCLITTDVRQVNEIEPVIYYVSFFNTEKTSDLSYKVILENSATTVIEKNHTRDSLDVILKTIQKKYIIPHKYDGSRPLIEFINFYLSNSAELDNYISRDVNTPIVPDLNVYRGEDGSIRRFDLNKDGKIKSYSELNEDGQEFISYDQDGNMVSKVEIRLGQNGKLHFDRYSILREGSCIEFIKNGQVTRIDEKAEEVSVIRTLEDGDLVVKVEKTNPTVDGFVVVETLVYVNPSIDKSNFIEE